MEGEVIILHKECFFFLVLFIFFNGIPKSKFLLRKKKIPSKNDIKISIIENLERYKFLPKKGENKRKGFIITKGTFGNHVPRFFCPEIP